MVRFHTRFPGPLLGVFLLSTGVLVAACSSDRSSGFDPNGPNGGTGPDNGQFGSGADGGPGGKACVPNPANYDIPGNNCDDDGDGTVDNPPTCDSALAANGSADDFAKAMGICTKATEKGYGLVSAVYTRGYNQTGAPKTEQHGVLAKFGNIIKPREGKMLGVLSTGYAREYNGSGSEPFGGTTGKEGQLGSFKLNGKDWWGFDPLFTPQGTGKAPPGFPKPATGCPSVNVVNDVINLKLTLKAPPNAAGIKFDFNFYSGEWPAYICSAFNDGFIAYLTAKGFNGGKPDNMSFDKNNNPVSVNNGFFDRCTANVATGCASDATAGTSQCPGGTSELAGTGYGQDGKWCGGMTKPSQANSTNGGATGWLTSQAPVQGGETFTLEFMIWDTGDAVLDSSVLLDNFTWVEGNVTTQTDRPK
jgi:hypothetical protein